MPPLTAILGSEAKEKLNARPALREKSLWSVHAAETLGIGRKTLYRKEFEIEHYFKENKPSWPAESMSTTK